MVRAALKTASIPEPHNRFTVAPGMVVGRPASNVDMRGDVAVVLASGVRCAEVDLFDDGRIHATVAGHQCPDGVGTKVIRADTGECATVAADRGADSVNDEDFGHNRTLSRLDSAFASRGDQRHREKR